MKNVINKIKERLKTFILNQGYIIRRATSKHEILNLIKSLHPIQTEFELLRFGPDKDGGYLIPNDVEDIEACFSPGVDKISDFELDCLNYNMKIYMADKSIEKPNLLVPKEEYEFLKKYVGCTTNNDFITLDDWVKSSDVTESNDLILQMDIEGGEYHSIINMSDTLINRFRIMVIEFHSLQDLWVPHFFDLNKTVFDKILQSHVCIHIHPNNCCGVDKQKGVEIPRVAEFTFLRKDRFEKSIYQSNFPHKLDFDNTPNEHIVLPKIWYHSV